MEKGINSKTPHVIFQFLVVKPNQHQISEVKQLAKEMGVNEVALKTAQIYDHKHGSPLIPDLEEFSRYKKDKEGKYSIKNSMENNCWKMWHSCVITWDGLVVPCCFDKDAHHRMGDMKSESFRSLWKGSKYKTFRQSLMRSRTEIEMCKNCTEGTKVFS